MITLFPGLALTFDDSIKSGGNVYSVLGAIEGLDVKHLLVVSHNPFLPNPLSVMALWTRIVIWTTRRCIAYLWML